MHTKDMSTWTHDHVFGQDKARPGERRTLIIVIVTAVFMVVEVIAGLYYGSMALLADGLHMASHAAALGISVAAYVYARRQAANRRFSFGTGKVNSLAAFASAILLVGFAALMAVESIERLFNPVLISFDQAILVAVLGLLVNGASAWLLASTPHHHHHDHGHDHGHHHHHHDHAHHHDHNHAADTTSEVHRDHNLRAAYLHVLADALTSLLAILALLAGKFAGANWLDPVMGIVGAILVAHWSFGLLRMSAKVLLDWQAEDRVVDQLRSALMADESDRIADVHVWAIGQGQHAAEVTIVSHQSHGPNHYKSLVPEDLGIAHITVEVHRCTTSNEAA
ncbi:CDF family Co(II)/Ni(II) efflux transporter DmeF [Roseibium sp. MMSF_3544]|uniref:CDF family Co(II)/Ni(II) efflux transporter DmeF n=1 Tax=unclassified Roseibium TaxID=2629323 RepID=UPI00273E39FE|nr:CDF family Co(II)/Ni(II) efflux transporter DmeF [Roseibium sp. MMSF_3544]